jgi:hypothetical protein
MQGRVMAVALDLTGGRLLVQSVQLERATTLEVAAP